MDELRVTVSGKIEMVGEIPAKDGKKAVRVYQFKRRGRYRLEVPTVMDNLGLTANKEGDQVSGWDVEPSGVMEGKRIVVNYYLVAVANGKAEMPSGARKAI